LTPTWQTKRSANRAKPAVADAAVAMVHHLRSAIQNWEAHTSRRRSRPDTCLWRRCVCVWLTRLSLLNRSPHAQEHM
jgi:hypothetical protein